MDLAGWLIDRNQNWLLADRSIDLACIWLAD
jgi:hypothetical protein